MSVSEQAESLGVSEHVLRNAQDMASQIGSPVWLVASVRGLELQSFPVSRSDEIRSGARALAVFSPAQQ